MEEVSVRLVGGLGNYMFQIACAYAYSLKHSKKPIFTTDDSMVVHKHLNYYKDNILNNVPFIASHNLAGYNTFNESGFEYKEVPHIDGNVYLNGYFQTEKYFKEYEKEIKELFEQPQFVKGIVVFEVWDKHKFYLNVEESIRLKRLKNRDGITQQSTLNHITETAVDEFKDDLIQVDASGTLQEMYENLDKAITKGE